MKIELYYHHASLESGRTKFDSAQWGDFRLTIEGVSMLTVVFCDLRLVRFDSDEAFAKAEKQTGWNAWDDRVLEMPVKEDLIAVPAMDCYFSDMSVVA